MNSEIENARNKIMNSMKLLNSILDIDEEKIMKQGARIRKKLRKHNM